MRLSRGSKSWQGCSTKRTTDHNKNDKVDDQPTQPFHYHRLSQRPKTTMVAMMLVKLQGTAQGMYSYSYQ